jgi:Sec-independent protein secretion pathway component TatC
MSRSQFLRVVSVLLVVGFAIASLVSPPDVYSQLLSTLVLLLVVIPFSYWLVYRREFSV